MSFYSITFLFLLILLPLVMVAAYAQARARARARHVFAPPELLERFSNIEPAGRSRARAILVIIALGLLVVGFARPQGGERTLEEEVEGIDIVLAIDISRSMLARDLYPNRLNAIKEVVYDFVDSSIGDRIGIVAFAGDATVVCPLTTDHGSVVSFIDRLDTNEPIRQGTGIGNAIHLAVNRFRDSEAGRVLILLTDGENNKGLDPIEAAEEAADAGVRVYTVGIGTPAGSPLPEDESRPLFGAEKYRRDSQGETIMVGLDESTLREIARMTGGRYFTAANQMEVRTLYNRIAHEGATQFQTRRIVRRDELAPYFLLLACLFLIMEAFYAYIPPSEVKRARARS